MDIFNIDSGQWWDLKDISYSLQQMKWLVGSLPILKDNNWVVKPDEPEPSEPPPPPPPSPTDSPAALAAEIDARLVAAGQDGWLARAVLVWGEDETTLGLPREELERRVTRCLNFISGQKRKKMRYKVWAWQSDYRHRKMRAAFAAAQKKAAAL
jgi:hypothetical protein